MGKREYLRLFCSMILGQVFDQSLIRALTIWTKGLAEQQNIGKEWIAVRFLIQGFLVVWRERPLTG